MRKYKILGLALILSLVISVIIGCGQLPSDGTIDGIVLNENGSATKNLIFIHHSVGANWLKSGEGGGNLCNELNNNGYAVSDIYYGWKDSNAKGVNGDQTDTINWPSWFNDRVMPFVYKEPKTMTAPNSLARKAGENEIIMFKSCFPNSDTGDSIEDEKSIYNDILKYFDTRRDKMFILVTPPPMVEIPNPTLTRQLCDWLMDKEEGWLAGYEGNNVFVFDLYNVLTHPDNHHMMKDGVETHMVGEPEANELYYDRNGDSHPNEEGNKKATAEFIPLLNYWYDLWKQTNNNILADTAD